MTVKVTRGGLVFNEILLHIQKIILILQQVIYVYERSSAIKVYAR